jgi:hypothetical protein
MAETKTPNAPVHTRRAVVVTGAPTVYPDTIGCLPPTA